MTSLTVRGLAAGYHGFQVLQGLELDVPPGITVVLGPNGAGTTTLLKALAGLLRAPAMRCSMAWRCPRARPRPACARGWRWWPRAGSCFPR